MSDLKCGYCGATFARPSRMGPPPQYCSDAHRQRAYELRCLQNAVSDLTAERDSWRAQAKEQRRAYYKARVEADQLQAIVRRCEHCSDALQEMVGR